MMVDAKGRVVQCNLQAQELLDLPPDLVAINVVFGGP